QDTHRPSLAGLRRNGRRHSAIRRRRSQKSRMLAGVSRAVGRSGREGSRALRQRVRCGLGPQTRRRSMLAKSAISAIALIVASAAPAAAGPTALPGEEPFIFAANSGESVEAFRGGFEVPENRSDPQSRMIPIRYVRFPATGENPGSPIVYLAGGPGAPGIG